MTASEFAEVQPSHRIAESFQGFEPFSRVAERAAERFRAQLEQSPTDRMRQMEREYNVRFTPAAQTIESPSAGKVQTRNPTIAELDQLEKAMKRFYHLSSDDRGKPNFRGLRFDFVDTSTEAGKNVRELGWYQNSRIGFGRPMPLTGEHGFDSVAVHELVHHVQAWRAANTEVSGEIRRFFGFEQHRLANGKEVNRLRDRDGNFWEFREDEQTKKDVWMPVENGRVNTDPARRRTNEQMRDNLPPHRQPASHYFDNPEEAHAEALTLLLRDRKTLFDRNPDLYYASKRWDQKDIDMKFGWRTQPDGTRLSRMMRNAEGIIVPNTPENRAALTAHELTFGPASAASRRVPPKGHESRICSCHQ
jgi:hypothetical protein